MSLQRFLQNKNFNVGGSPIEQVLQAKKSDISSPSRKLAPITRALYSIYLKNEPLSPDWQPFLVNRFISFNKYYTWLSFKIDRYTFTFYDGTNKEILGLVIDGIVSRHTKVPWVRYIKKPEEKKEEYEFILKGLQQHYKLSDKDLEKSKKLIFELIKDKKKLLEILKMCGADIKLFTKFGFKFEKPIDESNGLGKWISGGA